MLKHLVKCRFFEGVVNMAGAKSFLLLLLLLTHQTHHSPFPVYFEKAGSCILQETIINQ